MKIIHIIPAAFDYFDEIKNAAMRVVEGLEEKGVEGEIITIHYGTPKEKMGDQGEGKDAKRHRLIGSVNFAETVSEFDKFDIVHVHSPMFGAAGKICDWKMAGGKIPLVTTYYGQVPFTDIFSLFIKCYNYYYLPRLFAASDIVSCLNKSDFSGVFGSKMAKNGAIELCSSDNKHLTGFTDIVKLHKEEIVLNLLKIYKSF